MINRVIQISRDNKILDRIILSLLYYLSQEQLFDFQVGTVIYQSILSFCLESIW
jgi:hypothetical protein